MAEQAGYFTDESMLRRINRERALVISGPRALLMQAAHPLAVEGLLAHTDSLDEPYERLERVADGAERDRVRREGEGRPDVQARARDARRRSRGELNEDVGPYKAGTPYRADDPELLLWVLFTLIDSALVVYRKYVGEMARSDEAALLGGLQGGRRAVRARALRRCRTRSTTSTTTAARCSTATAST